MYRLLRSAYEPGVIVDKELLRKTATLVQKHTHTGAIQDALDVHEINEQTLKRIAASQKPDIVKVFNLLKSLRTTVDSQAGVAPYLLSIGERAERVIAEYQNRQISTQEALRRLEELVREVSEAERARADKSLPGEVFAVYWLLKRAGVADPESAAQQMAAAFSEHPHWASSAAHERDVRKEPYKALLTSGMKQAQVSELAQQVMNVVRRARA